MYEDSVDECVSVNGLGRRSTHEDDVCQWQSVKSVRQQKVSQFILINIRNMLSSVFSIYCLARNGNLISHSFAFSIIIGIAADLNVLVVLAVEGTARSHLYGAWTYGTH